VPLTKRSPISGEHPFRFRREERLKGRDEIRAVFNGKRAVSCPGAKLFVLKNGLSGKTGDGGLDAGSGNRIAVTFARKFGNAVERNRARRVSREAYRLMRNQVKSGFDLVLLIYPGKDCLAARTEQLRILFSRAGLFMESK
jgi:ribonuclease P protein component